MQREAGTDCGFGIADLGLNSAFNPQSEIPNPKSTHSMPGTQSFDFSPVACAALSGVHDDRLRRHTDLAPRFNAETSYHSRMMQPADRNVLAPSCRCISSSLWECT